jgi:hypothetical protein
VTDWDEEQGCVSRAFDEWKLVEGDQRAFLRLGIEFATREYDRLWKEAEADPYYEGRQELPDPFEAKVGGLYQNDFQWMLHAAALRDAVTSFEVYLEKAREEVLAHHGQPIQITDGSPYWGPQKRFFRQLGVEIETDEVKEIRALRGSLTHRRGELRTEGQREQYRKEHLGEFLPQAVDLSQRDVVEAMDKLAAAVRLIDAAVYEFSWGRARIPNLIP